MGKILTLVLLWTLIANIKQVESSGTKKGREQKKERQPLKEQIKYETDIIGVDLASLIHKLQKQIDQLQKQQHTDRNNVKRLEKKVQSCEQASTECELKLREFIDKVDSLQLKVFDMEMNMAMEYERIEDLATEQARIRKTAENTSKMEARLLSSHDQIIDNLDFNSHEIEKIAARMNQLSQNVSSVRVKQERANRHLKKINHTLSVVLQDIAEHEDFIPEDNLNYIHASSGEIVPDGVNVNIELIKDMEGSGEVESTATLDDQKYGKVTRHVLKHHKKFNRQMKYQMNHLQDNLSAQQLEISTLQDIYQNLNSSMAGFDNKVLSIHITDTMDKFQQSALNLTQNIISFEKLSTLSYDIMNNSQHNQNQIVYLTNLLMNNTNRLNEMEFKVFDQKYALQQRYDLLQTYFVNLNKTVHQVIEKLDQHDLDLEKGKEKELSELSLHVLKMDNRVTHLEVKVLNESLLSCRKSNNDFYQDLKFVEIQRDMRELSENVLIHEEKIKRMDHGLHRVFHVQKESKEVVDTLQKDSQKFANLVPEIFSMQDEAVNFLHHLPKDCTETYNRGETTSGVYILHPVGSERSIQVYCDMSNGTGWTVIQRRYNGSEEFERIWNEYANGFGDVSGEYWMGNENIHYLTSQGDYVLRIEMVDIYNVNWLAEYDVFHVKDEKNKYEVTISGYHGNTTDSFGDSNGMAFSTQDQDNDASSTHCAKYYTAGWWYKHCQYANLNGRYEASIAWFNHELDEWMQLKQTVMKISPRH